MVATNYFAGTGKWWLSQLPFLSKSSFFFCSSNWKIRTSRGQFLIDIVPMMIIQGVPAKNDKWCHDIMHYLVQGRGLNMARECNNKPTCFSIALKKIFLKSAAKSYPIVFYHTASRGPNLVCKREISVNLAVISWSWRYFVVFIAWSLRKIQCEVRPKLWLCMARSAVPIHPRQTC